MKWQIDTAHSLAEFSVKHMMVSTVKGSFKGLSGEIEWDEKNPAKSKVEAVIDVTTITTNDAKRDAHLVSGDFFESEKYPQITFKSTRVQTQSDTELKVVGDLSIHGVTKEVTLDVEYNGTGKNPWGMTVSGFTAKTSINRKDFNLNWNVALETGGVLVSEKVNITLEIEAAAKPAEAAAEAAAH